MSSNADDTADGGADTPEGENDDPVVLPVSDGVDVSFRPSEQRIVVTFMSHGEEIFVDRVGMTFYDDQTAKGQLKNDVIAQLPDDVDENAFKAGYSKMCVRLAEADMFDSEEFLAEGPADLLKETIAVKKYGAKSEEEVTVTLAPKGGDEIDITFDRGDWTGGSPPTQLREEYWSACDVVLSLRDEDWREIRDAWNDDITTVGADSVSSRDELLHEVIRRIHMRIDPVTSASKLELDEDNALYDPNNETKPRDAVRDEHGKVDVLWIQSGTVREVIDSTPGVSVDNMSSLAKEMLRAGYLLAGSQYFGTKKLPMWCFDAEHFGGRDLIGDVDPAGGGDTEDATGVDI